jgi:hypothetical protein
LEKEVKSFALFLLQNRKMVALVLELIAYSFVIRNSPRQGLPARSAPRMAPSSPDVNFVTWASIKAASSLAKVELASFGGLRGLRATQPLAPRDESISWPASLALQVTTGMRAPENVSKPLWEGARWYTRLSCLLLIEQAKGSDSELGPWICALPQAFDTPYSWSDGEIGALQYPPMASAVDRQRAEWSQIHAALNAEGFACSQPQLEWALHCVRSRAFSGAYEGSTPEQRIGLISFITLLTLLYPLVGAGSWSQSLTGAASGLIFVVARDFITPKVLELRRYVLCPLIDMLNHDGTVSSDVAYRVFTNTFCVTAERAVAAGDEVRISYGARSNDQLLQYHGFVEEGCVHDVYVMPRFLEHVDGSAGVPDSALDRLQAEGLLQPLKDGVRFDREGRCDPLSARIAERLAAALGGAKSGPELLLDACRLEQRALPTTLEEDAAELAQLGATSRSAAKAAARGKATAGRGFEAGASSGGGARTILQFRVAKKMLLARAIAGLQ